MSDLKFKVVIDQGLDRKVEGVVAFGNFETEDSHTAIYSSKEVRAFYRDLILGRSFPLTFVVRRFDTLGSFLAITLFLHRDLAIHPAVPGVIAAVELVDDYNVPGLAHLDRDLSRFLKFLISYLNTPPKETAGQQEMLGVAIQWLRSYILDGTLPSLPSEVEIPRILDQGIDGFVVAASLQGDLVLGWEELYRLGFLRGVLFHQISQDRWRVLAARKSPFLSLNLQMAREALNTAETAMDEPPEWATDGLWLKSPDAGTLLLPSTILEVLIRV